MHLSEIIPLLAGAPEFRALVDTLQGGARAAWSDGLTAPARALFVAALRTEAPARPLLLLVPSAERADQLAEDLMALGVAAVQVYPQLALPTAEEREHAASVAVDLGALRDRLQALRDLLAAAPTVVVAPITAALQPVPAPTHLRDYSLQVRPGDRLALDEVARKLTAMGYERLPTVEEPGQFAIRGGILDIFPVNEANPTRVDLFGDDVDSIRAFDAGTQRSLQPLPHLLVLPVVAPADGDAGDLLDYLPAQALAVVEDPRQVESRFEEFCSEHAADTGETTEREARRRLATVAERLRRHTALYLTLGARSAAWDHAAKAFPFTSHVVANLGGITPALQAIEEWRHSGWRVVIASDRSERLVELFAENGVPITTQAEEAAAESNARARPALCVHGALSAGCLLPSLKLALLTDGEVFGTRKVRRPRRVVRQGQRITSLAQLKEGDHVVHLQHGIGVYRGLVQQNVEGATRDYLHLEYAENTRLFVPVEQLDRVTKYIGSEEHPPQVHRLGGTEWQHTKQRARARVREMAAELVALYAARQAAQGHAFGPDTPWQAELEESFIYEETPDQLTAIQEVKSDMERTQPMDRLVCGDVGYGKTEVAIRAAFKAVTDGKQVAVLVPTTVLAQQHFNTFSERLAAFPLTIETLSRFRSPKEQARVVKGLREGTVDIVIGTHRLLSRDVAFRDLGLVVVDEEQRFGVAHKERLKQLRTSVDVLTLTATPIPRTLHMSLSGIRDMSTINDPPEGRTPIRTLCVERTAEVVREAIVRELDRDGQVYFVHNRVGTIEALAEHIRRLVPHARVAVGHGQMPEERLEKVMLDFYDRQYDVLVCTTIIESGLDIPNVNTILIDNAPHLGLAQLYQLRGRVGRSPRQAYCYLLFDPRRMLTEVAEKRLEAIREFSQLGSGFQIALRDLELRGAGNLLGAEQHGFMLSVGFDLYCRMIAEAVKELRGEEVTDFTLPPADLPVDAHLPATYIHDDRQRLDLYKRMSASRTREDVQSFEEELRDRFGPVPDAVANLLEILRLRVAAAEAGVESLAATGEHLTVKLSARTRLSEKEITALWGSAVARRPGWRWVQVRPDRIVVELQGASALAAAVAVVRAVAEREKLLAAAKRSASLAAAKRPQRVGRGWS